MDKSFSELYDILSKVHVNLPLLNVIPSHVKFFKDISSNKRKYEPNGKVFVSEMANVVLKTDLPPKLKDPGSFMIDISIGNSQIAKAMLDLGASINLLPYSLYL
ncbi:hypothetical protein LIER_36044 [Lithospermum erythrorhizon]|uniref:Aspartic peptidase DDI1-type domain-containing protein n=1 Tax=Lithospermum erythrorhizon TaxID=34254 RepID=A0AAV3P4Q6_LITER